MPFHLRLNPKVLETLQAMIGGKFAPLRIMNNQDADMDSMITTVNTVVTETTSEILGKRRQKKNRWVTAELWKKRFEPEGSEK